MHMKIRPRVGSTHNFAQVNMGTHAEVYNAKDKRIRCLRLYELTVPWSGDDGLTAYLVILAAIILTDHSEWPLTLKIWAILIVWLISLLWHDIVRGFGAGRIRIQAAPGIRQPTAEPDHEDTQLTRLSLIECNFYFHSAKLLNVDEYSMPAKPSLLSFKVTVTSRIKTWDLWYQYEDFYQLYRHLKAKNLEMASKSSHDHELPRLRNFTKFCNSFRKEQQSHHGLSSTTSLSSFELTPSELTKMQTDSAFLQHVTQSLMNWLDGLRSDLFFGDDEATRHFLGLPSFKFPSSNVSSPVRHEDGPTSPPAPLGKSISRRLQRTGSASGREFGRQDSTTFKLRMDSVAEVPDALLNERAAKSTTPSIIAALTAASGDATTTTGAVAESAAPRMSLEQERESGSGAELDTSCVTEHGKVFRYVLEDGVSEIRWCGDSLDNFSFLDQPTHLHNQAADCRVAHGFKVRGLNYMKDKKKIEAPPAIGQLLCWDTFAVDTQLFGDRHDHAAALIPMVRHRVRIIQSLKEKPMVLLCNFQLPGDPPYSCVAYFAIPHGFHPDAAYSMDLQKAKTLFERFSALPSGLVEAEDRVVLPDLGMSKNTEYWQQYLSGSSNNQANTSNNNTGNSPKTTTDSSGSSPRSVTPQRSGAPDVDAMSSPSRESLARVASTTTSSRAAPAPTAASSASAASNSGGLSSPSPTAGKRAGKPSEWRAVRPAKPWGADIAWGQAGEYGNLGNTAFQNKRFKLVPQVLDAPWVVTMAVSSTPCLLGQKIVQRYFRSAPPAAAAGVVSFDVPYLEIDMHIGSSTIAQNIVGVCRTYSKHLTCNCGIVIQGESEDELPERVLVCMTMVKLDLAAQVNLTQPYLNYLQQFLRSQANPSAVS